MQNKKSEESKLCPCGKSLKECSCVDEKKETFAGCANCSCGHSG